MARVRHDPYPAPRVVTRVGSASAELALGRCRSWGAVLDSNQGAAAIAVARDVAARVADPALLAAAIDAAASQTAFPGGWIPFAVAEGDAGLALAYAYLDACFPGEGWDVTAHRFLTRAIRTAERAPSLPLGLFGGLSGLALTTSTVRRGEAHYQRLQAALDEALVSAVPALARATRRAEGGIAVSQFDAISGLSGVGAYLLRRRACRAADAALKTMLSALADLVGCGGGVPQWRTPPTFEYPTGSLNCGLAHGIPGPLALMALASREGVEVPGQCGAIRHACDWLVEHRVDDPWGVSWPRAVPLRSGRGEGADRTAPRPSRSAWCYGSPGVARALWLAGEALADAALRSLAIEAMEAVYRRPAAERNIDSPTFCHGVAGLLQITLRFAHDTGLSLFACAGRDLVAQLLRAHRPDRLLAFPSVEPGGNLVDRPGVLDGAIGVVMVLLGAARDVEPTWDRLFLLA